MSSNSKKSEEELCCSCGRGKVEGAAKARKKKREKKPSRFIECPLCEVKLSSQEGFVNHCLGDHMDLKCVVQKESFKNMDHYEAWERKIQAEHDTCWKVAAQTNTGDSITYHYRCDKINNGPQSLKACTSFADVNVRKDYAVFVKYCTQHLLRHDADDTSCSTADANICGCGSGRKRRLKPVVEAPAKLRPLAPKREFIIRKLVAVDVMDPGNKSEPDPCEALNNDPYATAVPVEMLLGCSSCTKLTEKVMELEAAVNEIKDEIVSEFGEEHLLDIIEEQEKRYVPHMKVESAVQQR